MKRTLLSAGLVALFLSACSGPKGGGEMSFPKDPEDVRREKQGKLTGDGISLFGGNDNDDAAIAGSGLAVNSFLWRATLDTLSFLPLASADPVGGVIITDWYENPQTPGERFKANATIMDKKLRADGVRVKLFKQSLDKKSGQWRDVASDAALGTKLEDAILTRARELKVASSGR